MEKSCWENGAWNHIRPSWWIHEWVAAAQIPRANRKQEVSLSRPPLYQNQIWSNMRQSTIDHLQHSFAAEDSIRDAPKSWSPRVLIWDSVDELEPKIYNYSDCLMENNWQTPAQSACIYKPYPTCKIRAFIRPLWTLSRALGGHTLPRCFLPGIPWSNSLQELNLPTQWTSRLPSRISRYITWPLHIIDISQKLRVLIPSPHPNGLHSLHPLKKGHPNR